MRATSTRLGSIIVTLTGAIKHLERLVSDNSPAILSGVAVAGTVATAVLTGRASIKAVRRLENEPPFELDRRNAIEKVWKLYIPPVATGVLTITCIIGANRIGNRRAVAMAAAFAISEQAFEDYKLKVVEKLGRNKERNARDELAQEQVDRNPVSSREVVIVAGKDVLCCDLYTGRYFYSDMESLRKAQNDLNAKVFNWNYASLTDFYELIGLPLTSVSDELGWNLDKPLELEFSTVMSEDNRPCIAVSFKMVPIRDYYRIH